VELHPGWATCQVVCAWAALFLNILATTTSVVALSRDRRGRLQIVALVLTVVHWLGLGAVMWHDLFN